MTPETSPSPLTAARRRDVSTRRARVAQALDVMRKEGIEITISSVAARARVHRSFIHRHLDLRADVYAAADQPSAAAATRDLISKTTVFETPFTIPNESWEYVIFYERQW